MKPIAQDVKSWHTRGMRGKYIVIEGHEGTGKTTQVSLLRQKLTERGIASIELAEPGGVPIAQELRKIIKNATLERDAHTNLLLFTAARREAWQQLAESALKEGTWVIAGRNWYSTLAIQGYGEGLSRALITKTTEEFVGKTYMKPDLSVILTMDDEEERQRRLALRGKSITTDTFESREAAFQERVRQGYEKITEEYNSVKIDAGQSPEIIADCIWRMIQPYI